MLDQGMQIEANLNQDPDLATSFAEDKAANGDNYVEIHNREIVALIAYLQRLGTDIKVSTVQE
jgi:cytochrome c oxidase cbb3-type subunit I/II